MKRMREWYDGLAERERRLLVVFLGLLGAFLILLVPYLTSLTLSGIRTRNDELRAAINQVTASRGKLQEIKARKEAIAARYANPAPPLAGFIESAARQNNIDIPESQDRPEQPHGKKFLERSTVVRMRKVQMLPLIRTLERIEGAGHPITISRLNIRARGREPDTYDVELGVSAFDSTKSGPGPAPAGSGAKPSASEDNP